MCIRDSINAEYMGFQRMAAKHGYAADLSRYMDKRLDIRLNCNRHVAGTMKGYDAFMNIVLDSSIEIISKTKTKELGTIVIRGNSIELWECIDKVIQKVTHQFLLFLSLIHI
eukprot:TRINITY_DN16872_c0_g1_i4.p1 TRINITY_DN16872_c0_g1~~TRINITY_DN16872_c0_g1_i4.p1  ORF type:complete len:112 (+),score=9.04 TRINITY_DN16872_c0_g1_i4:132-467(+)